MQSVDGSLLQRLFERRAQSLVEARAQLEAELLYLDSRLIIAAANGEAFFRRKYKDVHMAEFIANNLCKRRPTPIPAYTKPDEDDGGVWVIASWLKQTYPD